MSSLTEYERGQFEFIDVTNVKPNELLTRGEAKRILAASDVDASAATVRDFVWLNNYFRQHEVIVDLSNGNTLIIDGIDNVGDLFGTQKLKGREIYIEEVYELSEGKVFDLFTSWMTDEVVTVLKRFLKKVQGCSQYGS